MQITEWEYCAEQGAWIYKMPRWESLRGGSRAAGAGGFRADMLLHRPDKKKPNFSRTVLATIMEIAEGVRPWRELRLPSSSPSVQMDIEELEYRLSFRNPEDDDWTYQVTPRIRPSCTPSSLTALRCRLTRSGKRSSQPACRATAPITSCALRIFPLVLDLQSNNKTHSTCNRTLWSWGSWDNSKTVCPAAGSSAGRFDSTRSTLISSGASRGLQTRDVGLPGKEEKEGRIMGETAGDGKFLCIQFSIALSILPPDSFILLSVMRARKTERSFELGFSPDLTKSFSALNLRRSRSQPRGEGSMGEGNEEKQEAEVCPTHLACGRGGREEYDVLVVLRRHCRCRHTGLRNEVVDGDSVEDGKGLGPPQLLHEHTDLQRLALLRQELLHRLKQRQGVQVVVHGQNDTLEPLHPVHEVEQLRAAVQVAGTIHGRLQLLVSLGLDLLRLPRLEFYSCLLHDRHHLAGRHRRAARWGLSWGAQGLPGGRGDAGAVAALGNLDLDVSGS
eukprot:767895-Hanusia_phi.AAC.14